MKRRVGGGIVVDRGGIFYDGVGWDGGICII